MNSSSPNASGHHGAQRFLDAADVIGRRLVRDAIWSGNTCNWLVWTKEAVDGAFRPVYRAAPANLYLGVAGIALFLARLSSLTQDVHQRTAADGAARQIIASLARSDISEIGLFTGSLGAARALISVGEITGNMDYVDQGLAFFEAMTRRPCETVDCDLMAGHAGAILALLHSGEHYHRAEFLDHAERLGDLLLAAAEKDTVGQSWRSLSPQSGNLLGLSHGTTGIALALLELNAVRPQKKIIEAAKAALAYERSVFDPGEKNWPDFRIAPQMVAGTPSFPIAWCHGSTGMGLARLRMHELLTEDLLLLPEIDLSIQNAVRVINMPVLPDSTDFTPCHGLTGHAELLLMTGVAFGRADARAAAERVGDVGLEVFQTSHFPWPCGMPDCGETPSFMTGLAGIGYFYLRLYDPVNIPSVLLPAGTMNGAALTAAQSPPVLAEP